MTKIAQGTVPEYDHHQLAGESNQETRGLNSHESVERCDLLPRASSRANEVTMEQFERGELDAIEGPSLGRQQTQMMLQVADMLSIDAENGALLATAAAAMQSKKAMADDCRAHLLVLHAELDEAYYDDRLSDCAQRAAESIYLVIDITETELEQIESDALAVLATIVERCTANAARVAQLQAHAAELLGRMGEPNTHATTGQAIMSDANARNAAPPRPDQSRLLWATPLRLRNTSLSRDCHSSIHQIRWQRHWDLAPVGRTLALLHRRLSRSSRHASRQRTALRHTTTTTSTTTVTGRSTVKRPLAVVDAHLTRRLGRTDPSSCAMRRRFSASTRALSTGWVLAEMRTRTRVDRGPSSRRLNVR